MDQEEKNKKLQSSTEEATPLLSEKELADICKDAKEKTIHTYARPRVLDLAAAGTSRSCVKDEAVDEIMLEADISKKRRETEEEELAESISSFEGMADLVSPTLGCGLFYGIWLCLCHCLSSFMIQFPLHVLLLSFPMSIGFMGGRYMNECPMNTKLPYAMMVVGGVGTLFILVRLTLLLHTKFSDDDRLKKWLKKWTNFLEFFFFLSLIIQLGFSNNKSPNNDPLSPNYCNETFYSFVSSMNNVLITVVVVWLCLYCITGQRCVRRSSPL